MATAKPMSWGVIIAILVATSVVVGMTLGLLHDLIGLNPGIGGGAAVGVVAALLINNRRKALADQPKP